jgi:hypothetical protein
MLKKVVVLTFRVAIPKVLYGDHFIVVLQTLFITPKLMKK